MTNNRILAAVVLAVVVSAAGVGALTAFSDGDGTAAAQNADDGTVNETDEPDRRIHVSATGEAQAEPDQAVIRVAVTAEGDSVGEIRNQLANGSADLTSALDELDVEYETTGYDIDEQRQPRERPPQGEQQPQFEYEGTHAYEITADDPGLAGEVVDTAAESGAEIESVVLTLSDERREELRDAAIENAVQDASTQAGTIANASGLEVLAPLSIDASQQRFVPAPYESVQAEGDDAGGPPTEIASGTVSVTYEVSVSYEAVQG